MAVLSFTNSDGGVETHSVDSSSFSIGRGVDNDLVIQNPAVSRQHAMLQSTTLGHSIQDMGSKNGTWVNGTRLGTSPEKLTHGDNIVLGNIQVRLSFYDTDETVTASRQPWTTK